jgi:hypothetical protein
VNTVRRILLKTDIRGAFLWIGFLLTRPDILYKRTKLENGKQMP